MVLFLCIYLFKLKKIKYMKKLFLIALSVSTFALVSNAQSTTNCAQTCEVTKIVEEGPFLGVQIQNGPGNTNAQIIKVFEKTAAEKTGFVIGDVISKVDNEVVKNNFHLVSIIGAHKPGDKVNITYTHNGVMSTVNVRIGAKNTRFVTEKICCEEVKNNLTVTGGLVLYPNPTVDKISIKTNDAIEGEVTISIYNLQGKEVYFDSKQNTGQLNASVDVSFLTGGEYIVRISNAKNNFTEKLFISK